MEETASRKPDRLWELAALFLKLGIIGFGGPAAHIAMMEDEVVRRRGWLNRQEFLDLVGATNLIPGPNSTELAIHIGRLRAGAAGLFVAGVCFILPAMLLVLGCAWLYVRYGALPESTAITYGIKPVIIAVVAQALWGLGRSAIKTRLLGAIGLAALVAIFLGLNELLLLFAAATVTMLLERSGWKGATSLYAIAPPLVPGSVGTLGAGAALAGGSVGSWPIFWFFLKVGSVLFGSGYVLLAFLRADLVERWHWLTEAQLFDAIAVGQITPGPVFTTATFIGFILGGIPGSIAGTVGIFLPAFVCVAVSAPFIARLRASPVASSFLDGLNVASLALMAAVTWHLGAAALQDVVTVAIALTSAALLIHFRVNSAWLVGAGALIGYLVKGLTAG